MTKTNPYLPTVNHLSSIVDVLPTGEKETTKLYFPSFAGSVVLKKQEPDTFNSFFVIFVIGDVVMVIFSKVSIPDLKK